MHIHDTAPPKSEMGHPATLSAARARNTTRYEVQKLPHARRMDLPGAGHPATPRCSLCKPGVQKLPRRPNSHSASASAPAAPPCARRRASLAARLPRPCPRRVRDPSWGTTAPSAPPAASTAPLASLTRLLSDAPPTVSDASPRVAPTGGTRGGALAAAEPAAEAHSAGGVFAMCSISPSYG